MKFVLTHPTWDKQEIEADTFEEALRQAVDLIGFRLRGGRKINPLEWEFDTAEVVG